MAPPIIPAPRLPSLTTAPLCPSTYIRVKSSLHMARSLLLGQVSWSTPSLPRSRLQGVCFTHGRGAPPSPRLQQSPSCIRLG